MPETRTWVFGGRDLARVPSFNRSELNLSSQLYPEYLRAQLQATGTVPREGFVRIPVSGLEVGTRQTGGQLMLPGEAAWNATQWQLPAGPAYSERPNIGESFWTDPGKWLLSRIPFVGKPLAAGAYAAENPVQWNRPMTEGQRGWETFKNLLGYAGYAGGPVGQGLTWASRGIDVAEGIHDLFSPETPFQDRTGVLESMQRRDVPGGPSFAPGGSYYDLPQYANQYAPPSWGGMVPSWGGEPGGEGNWQPAYQPPPVVPSWGGEPGGEGWGAIPSSGPTDFGSTWNPDDYWAQQGPQAA